ncbi:MAG: hypothetical protein WEG40_23420 [Candidatus Rokuibacteriota bacterium]
MSTTPDLPRRPPRVVAAEAWREAIVTRLGWRAAVALDGQRVTL